MLLLLLLLLLWLLWLLLVWTSLDHLPPDPPLHWTPLRRTAQNFALFLPFPATVSLWSWPHLAKPHLAKTAFGQKIRIWPICFRDRIWCFSILAKFSVVVVVVVWLFLVVACCYLLLPVGACWCFVVVVGCLCVWWVCSRFLGLSPGPPPPSRRTAFPLDRPKFRSFFSLSCRKVHSFFSLWGSSRGILVAVQAHGPPKMWVSVGVIW